MTLLDACQNGTLLDRSWKIDSRTTLRQCIYTCIFFFSLIFRVSLLDILCVGSEDPTVQTPREKRHAEESIFSTETTKRTVGLWFSSSHLGDGCVLGCREAASSIVLSVQSSNIDYTKFRGSTSSRGELEGILHVSQQCAP